jgi:molybdenum-dependent DNA-binding transcriptional regulator ModE
MDVRVLEYFLRVVELGSINRAAEELGLSQPSLSRWLSLLEHDIVFTPVNPDPQGGPSDLRRPATRRTGATHPLTARPVA